MVTEPLLGVIIRRVTTRGVNRIVELVKPHWKRGPAGQPTPPELFLLLYRLWLIAFTFKVLGASWDVSWHFRWLRDDLAPPHLLNSVGTVIVVALVIMHGYTGLGVDRGALRLIQWGTGVFLIAVPLDLINHRINGLDITSWSPSHSLLYIGTALMIAGILRAWHLGAPQTRYRPLVFGALWVFFLENVWFPAQHQEYGVLEIASWDRGDPYAEPILLEFAAQQIGRPVDREAVVAFSLPTPDWVYPMWTAVVGVLVLVLARRTVGWRWTATAVAGTYLGYRCLIWPLLVGTNFPASAVPFFVLASGLAVDLVFLIRLKPLVRAVVGAVVVTGVTYAALAAQTLLLVAPPSSYPSGVVAAVLLAALWWGGERLVSGDWWNRWQGTEPARGSTPENTSAPAAEATGS